VPARSVALLNLKPGTGKTTSAVWLAHIFADAGQHVLVVGADPSASAVEWSDLATMDPRLRPPAAFPFRIVALPSRRVHLREPEIAHADDVVIINAPQLEEHAGIARSVMRYVDEILIPCAPSPIEFIAPRRYETRSPKSKAPGHVGPFAVQLTRCITRARSTAHARGGPEWAGL